MIYMPDVAFVLLDRCATTISLYNESFDWFVFICIYIWQRMSSTNNTRIKIYFSNIIWDFYDSIYDFYYLSFCKTFSALS